MLCYALLWAVVATVTSYADADIQIAQAHGLEPAHASTAPTVARPASNANTSHVAQSSGPGFHHVDPTEATLDRRPATVARAVTSEPEPTTGNEEGSVKVEATTRVASSTWKTPHVVNSTKLSIITPMTKLKPPRAGNPAMIEYKTPGNIAKIAATSQVNVQRAEPSRVGPKVADDETHPCARTCVEGAAPMTCRYRFVIEDYQALSKACYACAANVSDCARPHCVAVDGVPRTLVVVNRQLPGPSVEVCFGDRVVVDVDNRLIDASTSVHWHGHHQRGTPFMDGVPYVTQCPVPPKSVFRYNYIADTPGTHFWHSHSGCQRADGAFGAFLVRVPYAKEAHAQLYDEDLRTQHTVQLLDWTHVGGAAKFLAHHHSTGDNKPDTILINGKGRWIDANIKDNDDADADAVDVARLATFTVQKGVRYRFRLINAGFLNCPMQLSIDNHTLTVIASDGSDLQPVEAASLISYAGERWDFVLSATAPVGSYWLRVRGLMDCDERFESAHQLAVLRYEGAATAQPQGPTNYEAGRRQGLVVNGMNVAANDADSMVMSELDAAVPDDASVLQDEADVTFYLSYDFHPLDNPSYNRAPLYGFYQVPDKKQRLYTPQLNHVSMRMPRAPPLSQPEALDPRTLCQFDTDARNCSAEFCTCTHVLRVPLGAVVELVLIDEGVTFDANHPFHLHGSAFRVLATDRLGSTTTPAAVRALDAAGLISRKLHNAPLKDTVTVPDGGYTIVRFLANNPGFWLFHCHIEFHVEVGMALVIQVGEQSDLPPVPVGFPRCGDFLPPDDDDEVDHVEVEVVPLSKDKDVRARLRSAPSARPADSGSAHGPRAATSLFSAALLFLLLRLDSTQ